MSQDRATALQPGDRVRLHLKKKKETWKKQKQKMTPRHILTKLLKTSEKEKTLKAARGKKHVIYKRTDIRMMADIGMLLGNNAMPFRFRSQGATPLEH